MTPAGQLVRPLPEVPCRPSEARSFWRTQVRVLNFIARYRLEHTYPPSIRQITARLDIPSSDTVSRALTRLQAKGIVTWERYQSRTLRIIYDRKETSIKRKET